MATMTREDALQEKYLKNKSVLFRGNRSHGLTHLVGRILDGSVVAVYPDRKEALVCFLDGHSSRTDPVKFDNLVAVFDKDLGTRLEIACFSGPMVDLRTEEEKRLP